MFVVNIVVGGTHDCVHRLEGPLRTGSGSGRAGKGPAREGGLGILASGKSRILLAPDTGRKLKGHHACICFFSLTSEIRASESDGRGQVRNFEDKHLRTISNEMHKYQLGC